MIARLLALSALVLLAGLPARAQDNKPQEVPCDSLPITVEAPSPKCFLFSGETYTSGRTYRANAGQRFAVGAALFASGGIIPSSDVHIVAAKADVFLANAQRANPIAREGTDWSPVRTVGGAWVATFVARKLRCFSFDNYGPPKNEGYAWNVSGFYCDPQRANAAKAFDDGELKRIIAWVAPK
jgi:hypothetical protein